MKRNDYSWLTVGLVVYVTACGPTSSGNDVSEGGVMDGAADIATNDSMGADGNTDVASLGMCNQLPVENLNALGTRSGTTLDYVSNNRSTIQAPTAGLQVSPMLQVSGTNPGECFFKMGHQRLFAYTALTTSALKISTTNPGTDPFLDTVLYVVDGTMLPTSCTVSPSISILERVFLGCNDDDLNYSGDQRRISSTAVTVKQVMMGQTVLIALGGFAPTTGTADETRQVGNFELTVQELPVVSTGACDAQRLSDACPDGMTCVSTGLPSTQGTCQTNGMVAGTLCDASGRCSGSGLTCLTPSFCIDPVAPAGQSCSLVCVSMSGTEGAMCDQYRGCATGFTCTSLVAGSPGGVCHADGSVVGSSCATATCVTGLACVTDSGSVCRVAISSPPTGAGCNFATQACPSGQDCVAATPSGLSGTCIPTGTAPGTSCATNNSCGAVSGADAGASSLVCNTTVTPAACDNASATGGVCNATTTCSGSMENCGLDDINDVYDGHCYAPGTLRGACPCTGSLMCSDSVTPSNGFCGNPVAMGAPCGLGDICPTGATCAQDPSMTGFHGTCQAQGAVAGSQCVRMPASGMPACGNGLVCSSWIPEEGQCQTMASAGGSCDPRGAEVRCPSPQVCGATSLFAAGQCTAATSETEPNDQPTSAGANMVTSPATVQAALGFADVDCYGVNVPQGGSLFAMATSPSGICALTLALNVYRTDAANMNLVEMIGADTASGTERCPRIEGNDPSGNFAWAVNQNAAETWYVCLRNTATNLGPVSGYVLNIAVN